MENIITKTDEERRYGMAGFLVPVVAMPEGVENSRDGASHKLNCSGTIISIDGQRFFKIEKWKKIF